jgi:uncharacterized protein (DUF1810 family)
MGVEVDPFNLARFRQAQAGAFDRAREELLAGAKRSHWMWFIFPQLRGLGRSETARFYGLASRDEAVAYLADEVLGPRLVEMCEIVAASPTPSARALFGSPDDLKLRSCATLFAALPNAPPVYQSVLDRYFSGEPDPATQALLKG